MAPFLCTIGDAEYKSLINSRGTKSQKKLVKYLNYFKSNVSGRLCSIFHTADTGLLLNFLFSFFCILQWNLSSDRWKH